MDYDHDENYFTIELDGKMLSHTSDLAAAIDTAHALASRAPLGERYTLVENGPGLGAGLQLYSYYRCEDRHEAAERECAIGEVVEIDHVQGAL